MWANDVFSSLLCRNKTVSGAGRAGEDRSLETMLC